MLTHSCSVYKKQSRQSLLPGLQRFYAIVRLFLVQDLEGLDLEGTEGQRRCGVEHSLFVFQHVGLHQTLDLVAEGQAAVGVAAGGFVQTEKQSFEINTKRNTFVR